MKYYIKEKLLSLHKRLYVYDETEKQVYEISSKVVSFGDKTTLYEMNGQKHAYIEQRVLHLLSHYDIYIEDQMICSIARKFQLFKKSYELINGYSVDGNIFRLHFTVVDPNGPSKERQSRLRNSMKLKSLRRNKNYLHLPF